MLCYLLLSQLWLKKKTLTKATSGRKGDHGSQFEDSQSLTAGEAWGQECETAGHVASPVRKQRWRLVLSSPFPLSSVQDSSPLYKATHIYGVFSQLSLPNLKISLQECPETCFLGDSRSCQDLYRPPLRKKVFYINLFPKGIVCPSNTDLSPSRRWIP